MGRTTSAGLRAQFERDGYVEFRPAPFKVAGYAVMIAGFPAVCAWMFLTEGIGLKIFAVLAGPYVALVLGSLVAEGLFGAGPALRFDRDGLTLRRWGRSLRLAWNEVGGIIGYGQASKRGGPSVAIILSPWVWHDYQATRPGFARLVDKLSLAGRFRMACPPKLLDQPAAVIVEAFDLEFVHRMTTLAAPYRLVLDLGEEGDSPLWMRGGRPVDLDQLPLSAALRTALTGWSERGVALMDGDLEGPAFDAAIEASLTEGRTLVVQTQAELGAGSEVRFAPDQFA